MSTRFEAGTAVMVKASVTLSSRDWRLDSTEVRNRRTRPTHARVLSAHDSHGPYYVVEHSDDFSRACYLPDEVQSAVTQPRAGDPVPFKPAQVASHDNPTQEMRDARAATGLPQRANDRLARSTRESQMASRITEALASDVVTPMTILKQDKARSEPLNWAYLLLNPDKDTRLLIPGSYTEAQRQYGVLLAGCPPEEWNRRTAEQNACWLLRRFLQASVSVSQGQR